MKLSATVVVVRIVAVVICVGFLSHVSPAHGASPQFAISFSK